MLQGLAKLLTGATRKGWLRIALVLLLVGVLGFGTRQLLRAPQAPEPTYEGRKLSSLVQGAVLESDHAAETILDRTIHSVNSQAKARIEEELADCAIKGLKTRDNPLLRKAHIFIYLHSPSIVRRHLHFPSREPGQARGAALLWVWRRGLPNPIKPDPVNLDIYEPAEPVLCELATSDPTPPLRWMAARALTHFKAPSQKFLPVMLTTLASNTDAETAKDIAQWCERFIPAPEKTVPALIRAIELKENSVKNECANALRAYGPRAGFAVEQLKTLAKTNHWPTASSAAWALQAIDPEAAVKAGIR
jgi:hypothetical protein